MVLSDFADNILLSDFKRPYFDTYCWTLLCFYCHLTKQAYITVPHLSQRRESSSWHYIAHALIQREVFQRFHQTHAGSPVYCHCNGCGHRNQLLHQESFCQVVDWEVKLCRSTEESRRRLTETVSASLSDFNSRDRKKQFCFYLVVSSVIDLLAGMLQSWCACSFANAQCVQAVPFFDAVLHNKLQQFIAFLEVNSLLKLRLLKFQN